MAKIPVYIQGNPYLINKWNHIFHGDPDAMTDDIPVNLVNSPGSAEIYISDPQGDRAKMVRQLSDYVDPMEDADTLGIIADRLEDLGDPNWREILERCEKYIRMAISIDWTQGAHTYGHKPPKNAKFGLPEKLFGIPVVVEDPKTFSTVQMPEW